MLGKMDDAKAREQLWEALQMLEAAFKYEGQLFLFDTDQPTAADFSVFAALKRLADPVSEMRAGIAAGYPSIWEWELGRLKTFYEGMNERFYVGRVKYSKL